MWLVPRDTRGLASRSPVPGVVRDALVRWYTGEGEDSDHRASVIMVVKARDHHQWIACDCLGEGVDPPLLSPAYLSEAETYYLRRLTSIRQRRPEHDLDCPFFREQAPPRIREKATATPRTINEPDGLFSAHRLAPEKLAQLPDDDEPDDRTRGVAIPRLARLLWLLMEQARVNVVEPLEVGEPRTSSMANEFAAMRAAAERIEIAPGIRLARHLYTHIDPYDRGIVFARLREAAKRWPTGHAPQAFLLLYALDISGTTVTLAGGRELVVRNRIRHIGVHQRKLGPPYLVLAVVGEHNPREGYAALRAYAQPVARPANFIAVHNRAERDTITGLLDLQYRLRRRGIGIGFKRLLFDIVTSAGEVRPDLVLDLRDFTTGEVMEASLQIVTGDDADALGLKLRQVETLRQLAPVVTIHEEDLEGDALEVAILDQLHID
ncbi:hypothetical protein J2Y58_003906 [Sphingomonas sp. BE138]|uniref:hypothetical protein n=1 Tax=Sphingomonas sp. BE138 TaxID=2817845 RepID=UPI00286440DF|nr:hypothetical protein [Sphingomonas sp. BE138]MDR6790523.1 hypothetical protein [Sphingomonas sp. BE138]